MAVKKVAFEFNPFQTTGIKVPENNRAKARKAVQDFVLSAVLASINASQSPVGGGNWKKALTKEYAKIKGSNISDLELKGDLLDALNVIKKKGGESLSLQVAGPQAGKADGNNRGTYGKLRTRPSFSREFIPRGKKTLRRDIWDEVRTILKGFK